MIVNRIYEWARAQPDKVALIDNGQALSYAAFAEAVDAARLQLAAQDLTPGRTAIVIGHSHAREWIAVLALRALGLTTICLHSIDDAGPLGLGAVEAVVLTDPAKARAIAASPSWAGTKVIALVSDLGGDGPAKAAPPSIEGPIGGHILYTSGTTGAFKKVLWDGPNEGRRIERMAEARRYHSEMNGHLQGFRLWTLAGFSGPLVLWLKGATAIFDTGPDMVARFLAGHGDYIALLPNQVDALFALAGDAPGALAGRRVTLMAGFTPFAQAERLANHYGAAVEIAFGATECNLVAAAPVDRIENYNWFIPSPDRVIQIIAETGASCGEGEVGELRIGLLDLDAQGYLDDADTTAQCFRDGFFHSGDLAVRRADGRIRVLGRSADVLNIGGQKIAAAPLEERVEQILGEGKACLFSGLNAAGEEELVIALELARMPPRDRLQKVVDQFGAWRRVRFEAVKAFPRTEAGMQKIRRDALRRMVWDDRPG